MIIAGNHDWCFEDDASEARARVLNATYLQDAALVIDGLKLWGSPWQPRFMDWAFNVDRGGDLAAIWAQIPADTDVLITHGPPHGVLDIVRGEHVGCEELRKRVVEVRPKLHVFGHIHECPGVEVRGETTFINASLAAPVPTVLVHDL